MNPAPCWFDTIFDEPVDGLRIASAVSSGQHPALRLADGFVRGIAVVGRFAASPGLLAFKVNAAGRPVRVRMWLRFDWTAVKWWAQRVVGGSVDGGRHARLLLVRAQGRLRHAVVLSRRRHGTTEPVARACVTFDLAPDELPDDGLLIVELLEVDEALLGPAAPGLAHHPTVGLQVDHVEIAEPDADPPAGTPIGWSACPGLGVATWGDLLAEGSGPERTGLVVVNPDRVPGADGQTPVRVSLVARRIPRPRLRSLPKRAVRRARREIGRRLPDDVRRALRPLLHRQHTARVEPAPTPAVAPARVEPAPAATSLRLRVPPTPASAVPTPPAPTAGPPTPPSALPASSLTASAFSLASGLRLPVDVQPGAAGAVDLRLSSELDGPVLLHVAPARPRHGFGFQVVNVSAAR